MNPHLNAHEECIHLMISSVGAGRPNRTGLVAHGKRPEVKKSAPVHITWKVTKDLVNLRCGEVAKLFEACALEVKSFGLRINHFSIQRDHLHLFAEADDNFA